MIKSHKFRGKRWKIKFVEKFEEKIKGLCEAPHRKKKTISILKVSNVKKFFETNLHEAIHSVNWDWDEEAVTEAAEDITSYLFRIFDISIKKDLW